MRTEKLIRLDGKSEELREAAQYNVAAVYHVNDVYAALLRVSKYSRTSVAPTPMARLPWLIRTVF